MSDFIVLTNKNNGKFYARKAFISSIDHLKGDPTTTTLFMQGEKDPYLVKESPEEIMKMLHNDEFNDKMKEVLK